MFVCLSDPQAAAEEEIPATAVTIMSTCYSKDESRYQNARRQNTITVHVTMLSKYRCPFPREVMFVCH